MSTKLMAPSVREHGRGRHSERWKGTLAITIDDMKHTDLTQAERDVLKADNLQELQQHQLTHIPYSRQQ
jgi:hypothetical protein